MLAITPQIYQKLEHDMDEERDGVESLWKVCAARRGKLFPENVVLLVEAPDRLEWYQTAVLEMGESECTPCPARRTATTDL